MPSPPPTFDEFAAHEVAPRQGPAPARDRLPLMLAAILGLATALAFAHESWWGFELLDFFRLQYTLVLGAGLAACLIMRRRGAAACMAIPLGLNLLVLGPHLLPVNTWARLWEQSLYLVAGIAPAPPQNERELRIAHMSVDRPPRIPDPAKTWIRDLEADLLFIHGTGPEWVESLHYGVGQYRLHAIAPRAVLLVRRAPDREGMDPKTLTHLDPPAAESMAVRLEWHGQPVNLLSLAHPVTVGAEGYRRRGRTLDHLAAWSQAHSKATVLVGGFSLPPWSGRLARFEQETGLLPVGRTKFGSRNTWPEQGGWMGGVPLDHCLHDPRLKASTWTTGPSLEMGRKPILVGLQWRPGAVARRPGRLAAHPDGEADEAVR